MMRTASILLSLLQMGSSLDISAVAGVNQPSNRIDLVRTNNNDVVPEDSRVNCHPSPNATKEACESNKCIWDARTVAENVPNCYFPTSTGYSIVGKPEKFPFKLQRSGEVRNPYGIDISPIYFSLSIHGKAVRIQIAPETPRYEPIVKIPRNPAGSTETLELTYTTSNDDSSIFAFNVQRSSTGTALWNTSIGGLLFAEQYIQIATYLPTKKIYGFGEHVHPTLMHNLSTYTTWPMFARDQWPDPSNPTLNLYGVQPFYLAIENDGKAHGVLIYNSNAQEVTLGPGPHLVYRTIGGILDITFFPGPTPEEVIQQYTTFIGKPFLPSYFALGFQLSRYGYKNLTEVQDVVKKMRAAQIPLDIVYADIDYMERYKDYTIGPGWENLSNYTEELHKDGMRLFLIYDPAIQINSEAFKNAIEMNASFIEWPELADVPEEIHYKEYPEGTYDLVNNTKVMLGVVWPDWYVAFPDFFSERTVKWWVDEIQKFHDKVAVDGIWIDMNEPAVFGTNEKKPWYFDDPDRLVKIKPLWCNLTANKFENPPYQTHAVFNHGSQDHLCTQTLCMSAKTNLGQNYFYDTKNLYGLSETIATSTAHRQVIGKRGAVISRSTFVSSGHYGGHWLGDNTAKWQDLRSSVIGIQEFNIFGIPYIGADICGFNGEPTAELCLRWSQLGAFYPFSRNHNTHYTRPQDPTEWQSVTEAAREALLFRYEYLPYLYSLHWIASVYGGTVVRPLFFEFPNDSNTYELSYQFMWGNAMMIVPVLDEGATSVKAYLPVDAQWYSMRSSDYSMQITSGHLTITATTQQMIPVFIRGGCIIPRQKPELTTDLSRENPFQLLIAMGNDSSEENMTSTGSLFWDDGISYIDQSYGSGTTAFSVWNFQLLLTSDTATLTVTVASKNDKPFDIPNLESVEIFGYPYSAQLEQMELDGKPVHINTTESHQTASILRIFKDNLVDLAAINESTVLTWPHISKSPSTSAPVTTTTHGDNSVYKQQPSTILFQLSYILLFVIGFH